MAENLESRLRDWAPGDCEGWQTKTMTLHTHEAILHTNHGNIRVGLYENHAPKTVKNFIGLATGEIAWTHPGTGQEVNEPLYTDVLFHRVIPGFMIQGGDPLGTGTGGPGYRFDDEIHPELAFNEPFLLAMANAGPGTNGSQFFITVAPTPWLQGKHTIFGAVLDDESRAVVQAIEATPTGGQDRPVSDAVIHRITITEA